MDFEKNECIVFGGPLVVRSKENGRKRFLGITAVLTLALLPVIALFVCIAFTHGGDGDGDSVAGGIAEESSDSQVVESTAPFEEKTEISLESSESGVGETVEDENFDEPVSLDLSKSEMGDCYIYNYSSLDIDSEKILASAFVGAKYSFSEEPLVMIVHSHTSYGYSDFDSDDPLSVLKSSVVTVGERLAERLNKLGISTVHVSVIHDKVDGEAYAETAKTIETMLEIYPTVEYVIDVGRFEMNDEWGRDVKTESADGCAQVRLTVSAQGDNWKDDLSLGLKLRACMNSDGKKQCMPVVVTDEVYNVGFSTYYFKADFGTAANSSGEAIDAVEVFAEAFKNVLKKK